MVYIPWAKMTYERTVTLYKDLLNEIISPEKRNIDFIIKELLIRAEILKHDFTKRQLIIIGFIFTFSLPYGKDKALIPKLMDFSLAGITQTKIKAELRKLQKMNVIIWEQEENLFSINDPREWDVPYIQTYNDDRSRELFLLNLDHAGIDVSKLIKKLKSEM